MLLRKDKEYRFELHHKFKGEFLNPIILNMKDKYTKDFDDYDEAYHCNKKIHDILKLENVQLDFHVLYKNDECVGIALISFGSLDSKTFLDQDGLIKEPDEAIVLNYFHICSLGRGNGTKWLNEIIIPYYKKAGKKTLYLKSSHPKAFSLYERLGKKIGEYTTNSDNHQFIRKGQIYEITL